MKSYSPPWAPHVVGTYPEKSVDPVTGEPEAQRVNMRCATCGATWRVDCYSGMVKQHVQNFALAHAHRDALRERVPGKR